MHKQTSSLPTLSSSTSSGIHDGGGGGGNGSGNGNGNGNGGDGGGSNRSFLNLLHHDNADDDNQVEGMVNGMSDFTPMQPATSVGMQNASDKHMTGPMASDSMARQLDTGTLLNDGEHENVQTSPYTAQSAQQRQERNVLQQGRGNNPFMFQTPSGDTLPSMTYSSSSSSSASSSLPYSPTDAVSSGSASYMNPQGSSFSTSSARDDPLITKLNFIISLLEEQQDERTNSMYEEVVLYFFLGVFIIFIVDSFVRVGKYVR